MSATTYEGIKQQIDTEFDCTHSYVKVAVKIASNGTKQYYRQCQRCGAKLEGPIKHDKLTIADLKTVVPINDELQRSWWECRAARAKELHDEARQTESAAWWRDYNSYLKTPKWRLKSRTVIERDVICQACLSRPAIQAHHKTYEHVGDEPLFDLVGVCLQCHAKLHAKNEAY
jgi:hypothetical protein